MTIELWANFMRQIVIILNIYCTHHLLHCYIVFHDFFFEVRSFSISTNTNIPLHEGGYLFRQVISV
jgi:hypothetical protein